MNFDLIPLALNNHDKKHLNRAATCINTIQTSIKLKISPEQSLPDDDFLNWPLAPSSLGLTESNIIAITSRPFRDKWFSHSARAYSVISTAGWSEDFAPPGLSSFLMMEIALSLYSQLADNSDDALAPHAVPIGCLFDWCIDKSDISWKMRCGNLCATHESLFLQLGGSKKDLAVILRILEATRLTACGRLSFDSLPATEPKIKVFIGSASETCDVAYAAQQCLENACAAVECTTWTDGVFRPGSNFLVSLIEQAQDSDYAVLIAGRDDVAVWRGDEVKVPRDNVTFELGLFMGIVGKDRTFIVCPEDAPKFPSDLGGVVHVRYRERNDGNAEAALRPGMTQVVREICAKGRRDRWLNCLMNRK